MPEGAGFDRLDWQVSSTRIAADCPFSSLPGLERKFMVIEGAGVELAFSDTADGIDRRERIDAARGPVAFSGDWHTNCRLLDGPVRVLNVITRRERCTAQVTFAKDGALRIASGETLVAVDVGTLDAWLLAGEPREAALPGDGTRRFALVRVGS